MSLKEQIAADLRESLRAGQRERTDVLRMLRARILEREVELRGSKGRDYQLSDEETIEVLAGYAKQIHQSIRSFEEGGRPELVEKEKRELQVVETYLPQPLSEAQIEKLSIRQSQRPEQPLPLISDRS
ncbi:MAG TPA: GatB/YqeY domain-containing protein [Acidobacteriota bacterium]|nr:GatB/YqeY domain-containing protein [Acidobacteriota bacterium]